MARGWRLAGLPFSRSADESPPSITARLYPLEDPLHLSPNPLLWCRNCCRHRIHYRPHLLQHRTTFPRHRPKAESRYRYDNVEADAVSVRISLPTRCDLCGRRRPFDVSCQPLLLLVDFRMEWLRDIDTKVRSELLSSSEAMTIPDLSSSPLPRTVLPTSFPTSPWDLVRLRQWPSSSRSGGQVCRYVIIQCPSRTCEASAYRGAEVSLGETS